jgi:hypothetical protein
LGQKPEETATKQPAATENDIGRVRRTFADLVDLDRAAIVLILQAVRSWVATRPDFPREFLREAPRRLREYKPTNRAGFLISVARSGEIYGQPPMLTDAEEFARQQAEIDQQTEYELRQFKAMMSARAAPPRAGKEREALNNKIKTWLKGGRRGDS